MMRALPGLLLWACADAPVPTHSAPTGLDADQAAFLLARSSLDLRGVRPSLDELAAIRAHPERLDATVDAFLEDARFRERVVASYGEIWNTVGDETQASAEEVGLSSEDDWARAVGEEPLRILAEVAATDLPWTTIVTTDWTQVDDQLAEVWPVEAEAGSGWRQARYTDGRPAAGTLSTNGLWWRYETSRNNADRARANQVSRIFLCRDYLDAEVRFDREVDLSDPEVVEQAIQSNPACVSCHNSLDPLAAALGGVFVPRKSGLDEFLQYHPEREDIWRSLTGTPPAYFGQPIGGLADLGDAIANDPGFVDCAVEQAATLLLRRPMDLGDTDRMSAWREAFLAEDLKLKALWRAILRSPPYRSAHPKDAHHLDHKLMSPDLLASTLEDLTGYRFRRDGVDMLRNADLGLRALAGGGDGRFATGISQAVGPTQWMVQEQLAQGAGWHLVHDGAEHLPDIDATADPTAQPGAIARLHERLLSRPPTDAETAELEAHWAQVAALSDAQSAWASVATVLLSDPELVIY